MRGYTDIHAHFLYGMDDGAQSRKMMEAMLDAAWADGVTALFATPHFTAGMERFEEERFAKAIGEAKAYCRAQGYDMRLFSGAEVLYTPMLQHYITEHRLPTLADTSLVLTEFMPDAKITEIEDGIDRLERNGYTPVLAHVERYVNLGSSAVRGLKQGHDVRYQVNCHSIMVRKGFLRDRRLRRWFEQEYIDYVATDAHNCSTRPTLMRKAHAELAREYGVQYADELMGLA